MSLKAHLAKHNRQVPVFPLRKLARRSKPLNKVVDESVQLIQYYNCYI